MMHGVHTSEQLRIFVASPTDANEERDLVRACVAAINEQSTDAASPQFELLGWDRVRGTAGRPQEAINALVDQSHYLICIFKSQWGSNPNGDSGYTSGTEEELFTALLGLADPGHPMRDVWVAFGNSVKVRREVKELRNQIISKGSLLFETTDGPADFTTKLSRRLTGWRQASKKHPRTVDLVPRSGRDVLRAAYLRRTGERLIELGQSNLGLESLEQAVNLGGLPERISLARHLTRSGQLEKAIALIAEALTAKMASGPDLHSPTLAEAYAFWAYLLRRGAQYRESVIRLEQALEMLTSADAYTETVRCRILDDIGLAHHGSRDYESALLRFEQCRAMRLARGDQVSIAQSEINLSRTHLAMRQGVEAAALCASAIERISDLPPSPLHANAHILHAQVMRYESRFSEGVDSATCSLVLNEQMGHLRGCAMAHNVLAQLYRELGDRGLSLHHAVLCEEVNEQMGVPTPGAVAAILTENSGDHATTASGREP